MDSNTPTNGNEIPSCSKDNDSPPIDALFDPSIDMLINDFDDERTLEEEEALAAGEANDPSTELSNLEKEGNMPLEELLALYGYHTKDKAGTPESGDEEHQSPEVGQREQVEKDRSPTPLRHSKLSLLYEPISDDVEDTRNMTSVSRISDEEEDVESSTEDGEFLHTPNNVVHSIMVGSDYQAQIPEEIINYDEIPANDEDDKLLWNPQGIHGEVVEEYLRKAHEMFQPPIPKEWWRCNEKAELRDDELALSLLKECGYNTEDALRKLEMRGPPSEKITNGNDARWLEEECHNSEPGVRSFGKNFLQIQQNKIND